MRGGFLHNFVQLRPVEAEFRELGADVQQEYRVDLGNGRSGYIDLIVDFPGFRFACEFELSAARIENDKAKASAAGAALLLIIVPNPRVKRSVDCRLARLRCHKGPRIICLTLGLALQGLENGSLLKSVAIPEKTSGLLIPNKNQPQLKTTYAD